MRALVIGGGSWGTAFACVLARRGHVVTLGVRDADAAQAMARDRTNARYLPDVRLEALVTPVPLDLPAQCRGAGLVALALPSRAFASVAAGAWDGLGFGDNAKAALMTRGLAEMGRLGEAFGADPRTYAGLAGLGDLVATCTSRHSRNRAAGEQIAQGVAPDEIEKRLG